MDQYCPILPKLSHTSAKIGYTRIVACLVLFARWKTHSGHIFLKRKKKRKKEHNCEVQWHFHCNWWMTFNCPDFTSNIFINPNYQPIKKQFFFLWSCMRVWVHACVSAGEGMFVTVAVWASDGVGKIWKWCECFWWKSLVETFRTALIVHLSYCFMLELDVVYEVSIYFINPPPERVATFTKYIFGNNFRIQSS